MSLKLHRACKVIGFTQKQIKDGWPQAFNLEQIAKLQFPENASDESVFCRALRADCAVGSLKHIATIERREYELSASLRSDYKELIRHAMRDNSYEVTVHYVDHRDLVAWLEKQGEEPSAHLASWIEATTPETPAPAVVAVGAAAGVEPDKAGPVPVEQGLSTKDIARAFDGVNGWDADRWPKNLSAAKWLHPARIAIGGAGGASSVWSPMMLAQLMHDRTKGVREKEKLMKVLNSRFTLNPALGLWRDAFNEYFATYCATD